MSLTTHERLRYQRQINLPNIGEAGQLKLKQARILVIGAGGLGSPLLLYLVAAGIGHITIIDADVIEESNLQRQILFTENDRAKSKVMIAKERLQQLNSACEINVIEENISVENAALLFQQYDIIADGSDNFATRYLVNDVCVALQKPFSHASVFQFQGFCMLYQPGNACYRCVFPEADVNNLNCSEAGILGSTVGVVATLQATQILHFLLQLKQFDFSQALQLDLLKFDMRRIKLQVEPECQACQKKNIQISESNYKTKCTIISEITAADFIKLQQKSDLQIVDVRELYEYQQFHLPDSIHIPLSELEHNMQQLQKNKITIAVCAAGVRSQVAATILNHAGFEHVLNLKGGLYAWKANNV